jgi:endo-1,4-beta-xylanase
MKNLISTTAVLGLSLLLGACGGQQNKSSATSNIADTPLVQESLAQSYKDLFQVGAAINRRQAIGDDIAGQKVVKQHYNVITAENDMKWESIQSQEGVFTFEGADALVDFAEKTNKDIIGHVLVWHSQTPDWVFEDAKGKPVTREVLLKRMKTQIFALAGRYKGKIKGWDVVNEAFNEDGSFRESKWFTIIGEDFIDKAFEFANQADPKAQLYYNDYTLYKPAKMNAAIALAKRLRSKGLRIDGIGIQGHYMMN